MLNGPMLCGQPEEDGRDVESGSINTHQEAWQVVTIEESAWAFEPRGGSGWRGIINEIERWRRNKSNHGRKKQGEKNVKQEPTS